MMRTGHTFVTTGPENRRVRHTKITGRGTDLLRLTTFLLVAGLLTVRFPATALSSETELQESARLVVMIRGAFDGLETIGAGIIFGRDAERIYIATAGHVIRQQGRGAQELKVLFRDRPEHWIDAAPTGHHDPGPDGLDLAVLAVEHTALSAIGSFDFCALPLDRLEPDAARSVSRMPDSDARQGRPVPGWLGVSIQRVTPEIAEAFRLEAAAGALVAQVVENSPAARAGIERGDVIIAFGDRAIGSFDDLPRAVSETPAGSAIAIGVIRRGESLNLDAEITASPNPPPAEPEPPAEESSLKRGLAVYPLGYPGGAPWGMPVTADRIAQVTGETLSFQSAFISTGHSGGALLTETGELVGLIRADQPPFGVAVTIGRVLARLASWGYPLELHSRVALHEAVAEDRTGELERLLSGCRKEVDRRLELKVDAAVQGWTPLHVAAYFNRTEAARLLLAHGADPAVRSAALDTPLQIAVQGEAAEVVRALLAGSAPRDREPGDLAYLMSNNISWFRWDLDTLSALIEYGADVNATSGFDYRTALHEIAGIKPRARMTVAQLEERQRAQRAVIAFLLAQGAEIDRTNSYGQSALHFACEFEYGDDIEDGTAIALLLARGANPELPDGDGNRPLHLAAAHRNGKAVEMLLEAGVRPDPPNARGETPLHEVLKADRNYGYRNIDEATVLEIARALLDAGADINARANDSRGETPLNIGGPSEAVRDYLRSRGALRAHELGDR